MGVNRHLDHLYVVIMAGGRGARFWPVSTKERPKQFLPIVGPEPMIVKTFLRVSPLVPIERIFVVAGSSHFQGIKEALPGLPDSNILIEPVGRNTAACIGFAAQVLGSLDPEAVMLVLPADHVIDREDLFRALVIQGLDIIDARDALVTFGITPDRPETGYGYIEVSEPNQQSSPVLSVVSFREKPDLDSAKLYLSEKRFFWNSGMFIWKSRLILQWIERLLPELSRGLNSLVEHFGKASFDDAIKSIYPSLPSVSIDYGVMEKADGVLVLPADIGWNDVGAWSTASTYWPRIGKNNVKGGAILIDSLNCAVYNLDKKVALVGVHDVIVVVDGDSILVCARDQAQKVKQVLDALEEIDGNMPGV
ncbi:MAG: mannose-1-phosphate guanylyltransferase [Pseudomonadota bacterium]